MRPYFPLPIRSNAASRLPLTKPQFLAAGKALPEKPEHAGQVWGGQIDMLKHQGRAMKSAPESNPLRLEENFQRNLDVPAVASARNLSAGHRVEEVV